jgi:hypothetical protein
MRAAPDYDAPRIYDMDDGSAQGIGWVTFAAILLAFAGIWNCIAGIAAISSAHVYTANANFVFSNLNTWGWIVLILAIVQIIAALALIAGSEFARWFGIVVAGLNAIGQLMFVPAYPWWAIAMFTLDILIIYALAVYGGHRLRIP